MVRIYEQLRTARQECGLSVRKAAAEAGLNPSQLSAIENGKVGVTLTTLEKILKVYKKAIVIE